MRLALPHPPDRHVCAPGRTLESGTFRLRRLGRPVASGGAAGLRLEADENPATGRLVHLAARRFTRVQRTVEPGSGNAERLGSAAAPFW